MPEWILFTLYAIGGTILVAVILAGAALYRGYKDHQTCSGWAS